MRRESLSQEGARKSAIWCAKAKARAFLPTLRYSDPDRELEFIVFSHRSPWAPAFLAIVLVIEAVRYPIVTAATLDAARAESTLTAARAVFSMVALLVACVAVARLLQRFDFLPFVSPTVLAVASEWLYAPLIAAFVVAGRVAFTPEPTTFRIGDHGIFTTTAIGRFDLPVASLLAVDAPRFFTIAPVLFLCAVAEAARYATFDGDSSRARIAAAWLAVFEFSVTAALVRVWELVRRRDFDARHATAVRASQVASLVNAAVAVTSGAEHRLATHNDSQRRDSTEKASSFRPRGNVRVHQEACVIVVRVVTGPDAVSSFRQLGLAGCLVDASAAAVAAFGEPGDVTHPPHGLRLVFVLPAENAAADSTSTPQEPAKASSAVRGAAFARALHRAFAAAVNRCETDGGDAEPSALAIGLHVGTVAVHCPCADDHSAALAIDGVAVGVANRLAETATEDATFVSGPTQELIADDYASRRVNTLVVGSERVAHWILGLPWSDAALRSEQRGRAGVSLLQDAWERKSATSRIRSIDDDTPPPASERNEACPLPDAAPSTDEGTFSAEDISVEPPAFRYTCWGFRFDDPDLEGDFRSTENSDVGRLAPVFTNVSILFSLMPWLFCGERGVSAAGAAAWCTFSGAAALCGIGAGLAWRTPPGQARLVVLTVLVTFPFQLLVSLAAISLDGPSNPATLYHTYYLAMGHVAAYHWLPDVLPGACLTLVFFVSVTISVVGIRQVPDGATGGPLTTLIHPAAVLIIEALMAASVRLRNRHRFAAVAAARISLERWAAMRANLERRFSLRMPRATARRLCDLSDKGDTETDPRATSTGSGPFSLVQRLPRSGFGSDGVDAVELQPSAQRLPSDGILETSAAVQTHGIVLALELGEATHAPTVHHDAQLFDRNDPAPVNRASALGFILGELAELEPFPFTICSTLCVWVNPGGCESQPEAQTHQALRDLRQAARTAGVRVGTAVGTGLIAGALAGTSSAPQFVVVGPAVDEARAAARRDHTLAPTAKHL